MSHEKKFLTLLDAVFEDKTRTADKNLILSLNSLNSADKFFKDETTCNRLLTLVRWPEDTFCPFCGRVTGEDPAKAIRCKGCGKSFSNRTNSIYERSELALRSWFIYSWCLLNLDKAIIKEIEKGLKLTKANAGFIEKTINSIHGVRNHPNFPVIAEQFKKPEFDPLRSKLLTRFSGIDEMKAYYKDDKFCEDLITKTRWPDGKIICPHCGAENDNRISKPREYHCNFCGENFTAFTGTVFSQKLRFSKILRAIWIYYVYMPGLELKDVYRQFEMSYEHAARIIKEFKLLKNPLKDKDFPVLLQIIHPLVKKRKKKALTAEEKLIQQMEKIQKRINK